MYMYVLYRALIKRLTVAVTIYVYRVVRHTHLHKVRYDVSAYTFPGNYG